MKKKDTNKLHNSIKNSIGSLSLSVEGLGKAISELNKGDPSGQTRDSYANEVGILIDDLVVTYVKWVTK